MITLVVVVHIVVCISLVLIVLLQTGKGASMGAAFGGSSQTLFGSSGPGTFLGKLTTAVAIIFMITSLFLAYTSTHRAQSTLMETATQEKAPASQETGPVPKAE